MPSELERIAQLETKVDNLTEAVKELHTDMQDVKEFMSGQRSVIRVLAWVTTMAIAFGGFCLHLITTMKGAK